ncbi:MAG: hypothetical protein K2M95_03825 [Clostridiales bacterium]|nr:hypothetical protein [Clostridiales bacterium]
MNAEELKRKLEEANIPPYLYNLDGKGRTDERFCLQKLGGVEWQVYYVERGVKTTDLRFATEEEACAYIYNKLHG